MHPTDAQHAQDLGMFWQHVNDMLLEATAASTVDQLIKACGGTTTHDGFFPGSGGDVQLCEVLRRPWRVIFLEEDYYWVAQDGNGDWVTYVEGDVIRGLDEDAHKQAVDLGLKPWLG